METYGKAFGKRVACDNLKAKKKKKNCAYKAHSSRKG